MGFGNGRKRPGLSGGKAKYNAQKLFEVPEWCEVKYEYANGTKVICGQSETGGTTFEGTDGTIHVTRDVLDVSRRTSARSRCAIPTCICTRARITTAIGSTASIRGSCRFATWRSAIDRPRSAILGNIAIRSQKKVHWDPVKEQITGDDELAKMTSRPYRAPWSLPLTS